MLHEWNRLTVEFRHVIRGVWTPTCVQASCAPVRTNRCRGRLAATGQSTPAQILKWQLVGNSGEAFFRHPEGEFPFSSRVREVHAQVRSQTIERKDFLMEDP